MSKGPSPQDIRDVFRRATCLFSATEVDKALDQMAEVIHAELHDTNPVVLCTMIGGVVPTGMLLTRLDFPLQVDYVHATRYHEQSYGQELEWLVEPRVCLKDRVVLVVDDILDGGITLKGIVDRCLQLGAKTIKTAVLVDKQVTREENSVQHADYSGVQVDDRFVFGFGMDYKRYLRNAPGIYAVAKEDE